MTWNPFIPCQSLGNNRACKRAFGAPIDKIQGLTRELVANRLQVVMACNYFGFNGSYYLQTQGTAMGTSCAPAFANLAIGFKEEGLLHIILLLGRNTEGLILYRCYIDDILLVFKGIQSLYRFWIPSVASLNPSR
jgi:predicted solute-binding protein